MMNKIAGHLVICCFIAGLAIAIGLPSVSGTFLNGDDQRFIIENALVNHPSWTNAGRLLTTIHSDMYQPLPMLSFQLNYALAGKDPSGRFPVSAWNFHLTNILLHALNAVLVFYLASRVAGCRRIGFLTALLFAVHPYASEPVGWICGRMILLGTTFALLTMLICVRGQFGTSAKARWGAIVAWMLSLASKVMPTVPIAAWFMARECDSGIIVERRSRYWRSSDLTPLPPGWLQEQQPKIEDSSRTCTRSLMTYGFMLVLSIIATIAAYFAARETGLVERTEAELTTSAPVRILLASRYYFENFFWPSRLSAWNPPPENVPFTSPGVLIALLEWLTLGALLHLARRRARLSFIGLVAFLTLLAPFLVATLARRGLTADRYMYLPSFGLCLALAAAFVQFVDFTQRRLAQQSKAIGPMAKMALALLAGLATAWLFISRSLSANWTTTIARDTRLASVYPDHVNVRAELAKAYIFENQIDKALDVISEAKKKWPASPRLALQAGMAYRLQKNWPASEAELAKAAAGMPKNARTRYYYARTLEMVGKKTEARAEYQAILELDSDYVPALLSLGQLSMSEGKTQEADTLLQQVVALAPYQRDALFELANLRIRQQNWLEAEKLLRHILDLDPEDRPALLNLAVVHAQSGRVTDAVTIYCRLLDVEPDALAPRLNRAALAAVAGRPESAEQDYEIVLRKYPDNREALIGLTELFMKKLRGKDLISLWLDYGPKCCGDDERNTWLTWAYLIDNQPETARTSMDKIAPTNPRRELANWAFVWYALRQIPQADVLAILGPYIPMREHIPSQSDYVKTILEMLAALPPATRNSPAAIYALARALSYENVNAAIQTATKLKSDPKYSAYSEPAKNLISALQTSP